MESIASTAIYLASSLTAVQAPPVPTAPAMIAASRAKQGIAVRPADVAVIANPFTAARNRGGRSLDEAIAAEVKRDAVERLGIDGAGIDGAGTGEETASLDAQPDGDESLSEDVTASHDARIGFIERQMEELRLQGPSAAPSLERLHAKLDMAMAARRLAVAREAIGHLPADCPSELGSDACRPAPMVAENVAGDRGSRSGRRHRSSASHGAGPAAVSLASAYPSSSDVAVCDASRRPPGTRAGCVADTHRASPHRGADRSRREVASSGSTHRPAVQRAARHRSTDPAVAVASDRARRLLATARHLLEDGAGPHPPTGGDHRHPGVKLAGLLQWEGSETWSLATYAKSAA